MSRRCDISNKKAMVGRSYSFLRAHYNPTSKRKFQVNLQTVRTIVNGKKVTLKVATSTLKSNPDIKLGITNKKRRNRKNLKKVIAQLSK